MTATSGARHVVTMWFVTAADPSSVLAAEPGPDRGFGRKYLALLDPRLPVAPIGDFPLNRSAPAGPGEFYIGGFDGLALVQTVLEVDLLSELPERYLRGIAATDVYAFIAEHDTGFGAFAHWRAGELKRAFTATRVKILEDAGLPQPFEADYWAGRHRPAPAEDAPNREVPEGRVGGVALPFSPAELADAAARGFLGFDPADPGPDIPVSAFAVDGRRAPALDPTSSPSRSRSIFSAGAARQAAGSGGRTDDGYPGGGYPGGGPGDDGYRESDYDDYEDHASEATDGTADRVREVGRAAAKGARTVGGRMSEWGRRAWAQVQKRNRG